MSPATLCIREALYDDWRPMKSLVLIIGGLLFCGITVILVYETAFAMLYKFSDATHAT